MLLKVSKEDQTPSLQTLARISLEESGNHVANAVERLVAMLLDSPKTLRQVMTEVVTLAASELVAKDIQSQRRAIQAGASQPKISGKRSVQLQARSIIRSFMDYPLAGGVLLRNATLELVERQRDMHATQASDNARKANWFAAIAKALPEDQTVGEALTEEQVRKFYERAFK